MKLHQFSRNEIVLGIPSQEGDQELTLGNNRIQFHPEYPPQVVGGRIFEASIRDGMLSCLPDGKHSVGILVEAESCKSCIQLPQGDSDVAYMGYAENKTFQFHAFNGVPRKLEVVTKSGEFHITHKNKQVTVGKK